jgi:two-component system LytT family sensor kinase
MTDAAIHQPGAAPRSSAGQHLENRQLLIALGVFWGVVGISSLFYGWEPIRQDPFSAWRPLVADLVGAALAYGISQLLRVASDRPLITRVALGMAYSIVAVFAYVVVALLLIIPMLPFELNENVALQILRMMSTNYWTFVAWSALFLVLDTGGSLAVWRRGAQTARQHQITQSQMDDAARRVMPQSVSYSGLEARWFWSFQGIFWGLMLIFEIANMVNYGEDPSESWRLVLIQLVGIGTTAIVHYLALKPSRNLGLAQRAAIAIGLSMLAVCVFVFATWVTWFMIAPVEVYSGGEPLDTGWRYLARVAPRWAFLNFPIFIGWSGFYLALDAARRSRQQEKQLYHSMMLAQEAKLKMLRFQLNPHFLFNTLNAISTLVLEDRNEEAEAMLVKLSRFLRFALDATPDDRVELRDELDAQRLYLEIERVRFQARLDVEIAVADDILAAQLPSLILQPVVENAIKYGVSRSSQQVHVKISAWRIGDRLVLEVTDDGPGDLGPTSSVSTGVGLANIRARLAMFYGDHASMEAGSRSPNGYGVRLELPYETREAAAEAAIWKGR